MNDIGNEYITWSDITDRLDFLEDQLNEGGGGLDEDEIDEVRKLTTLTDRYDHLDEYTQLILEEEWPDFVREEARNMGFNEDRGWPFDFIDWDRAGNALREDYFEISVLNFTYLIRDY